MNIEIFKKEPWFFQEILNNLPEAIILTDLDEKIVYVNKAFQNVYGYTEREVIGRCPDFLNAEKYAMEIQKEISECLKNGLSYWGTICNKRKNGTIFPVYMHITPICNEKGEQILYMGVQRDVNQEKRTEGKLIQKELLYTSVFQTSADMIFIVNLNGYITDCNHQALSVLNYSREEIIGFHLSKIVHYEDMQKIQIKLESLCEIGRSINNEYKIVKKGGEVFIASVNCSLVRDESQKPIFIVYSVKDISYLKEAENNLRESAEELKTINEELEQFASVASHDLQEPLRVVSNYCQLIKQKYFEVPEEYRCEEMGRYLDTTVEATMRMKSLIKELLDYSRVGRKDNPFEQLNLNEVIDEALKDLSISITESKAKIIIDDNLPSIMGIKIRIKQLFYNLLANALKFKKDNVPLKIEIGFSEDDSCWIFYVKDNGIGIEAKYLDRIFGVFKRLYSREKYPGNGIGLALCKRIVETHGGKIWADSEWGDHTYIYFTLSKFLEIK